MSNNKVLLMILDGWGNGRHDKADVISTVHPEYISAMTEKYPHAELRTDGENVGLPDGQMGNSEVGHLNIGAGRVVYQDLVKINRACRDNSIMQNPEVKAAFEYAKKNGVNVHFMGLVSDGGVHSSLEHLFKLCDIAAEYKIENTFVHCFMDGRDTDPRSGKGFVADLEKHMAASTGKVATVIGRYYAMDRDKRWERVKIAYDALVDGVGEKASDMVEAVQKSYDEGVTDEFIKPVVRVDAAGQPVGMIRPNDLVIFFNYRNDRAKELTIVLTQEDMPAEGMHTMPLYYCCMTPYDAKFTGLHILFDKENVPDTIGEWVSKQGLKQLRIAETEKYAHVTFFLNGGREEKFDGEERILVASPKVATYRPPARNVRPRKWLEKLVAALGENEIRRVICLNFANGDMVGHTGVYEADREGREGCRQVCLRGRGGRQGQRLRGGDDRRPRQRRQRRQCRRYAQHGALAQSGSHRGGVGPREVRPQRYSGRRGSHGAEADGAGAACRNDGQSAGGDEITAPCIAKNPGLPAGVFRFSTVR